MRESNILYGEEERKRRTSLLRDTKDVFEQILGSESTFLEGEFLLDGLDGSVGGFEGYDKDGGRRGGLWLLRLDDEGL